MSRVAPNHAVAQSRLPGGPRALEREAHETFGGEHILEGGLHLKATQSTPHPPHGALNSHGGPSGHPIMELGMIDPPKVDGSTPVFLRMQNEDCSHLGHGLDQKS